MEKPPRGASDTEVLREISKTQTTSGTRSANNGPQSSLSASHIDSMQQRTWQSMETLELFVPNSSGEWMTTIASHKKPWDISADSKIYLDDDGSGL